MYLYRLGDVYVYMYISNRPLFDAGSFNFENGEGDECDTTIYANM